MLTFTANPPPPRHDFGHRPAPSTTSTSYELCPCNSLRPKPPPNYNLCPRPPCYDQCPKSSAVHLTTTSFHRHLHLAMTNATSTLLRPLPINNTTPPPYDQCPPATSTSLRPHLTTTTLLTTSAHHHLATTSSSHHHLQHHHLTTTSAPTSRQPPDNGDLYPTSNSAASGRLLSSPSRRLPASPDTKRSVIRKKDKGLEKDNLNKKIRTKPAALTFSSIRCRLEVSTSCKRFLIVKDDVGGPDGENEKCIWSCWLGDLNLYARGEVIVSRKARRGCF